MPKLIALVTVVAFVDGVRQEFLPGAELPELPEHDVQELKRMNAIEDLDETALAEKSASKAETKAAGDFRDAKKAITAAQASIAPKK
ncbi:MAG: hypothetical protein Q8R67_12150 [Rhodoferax sp.]|nr:hypothetical protein [Rhodoferax sp.]MDP3652424.1 hypothetical protein [Rhodoferax sp.]